MKLFWSSRSPFARKVMVAAHEAGLAREIECIPAQVSPYAPDAGVAAVNPLMRIPTLVLPDGCSLHDSRVICEYLDARQETPSLLPVTGEARWRALVWQATGDGLLDALVYWRSVATRFEGPQVTALAAATRLKLRGTLDLIQAGVHELTLLPPHLGAIAVGVALEYLDFRFADERWRDGRQALAAWHAEIARRPSFEATRPSD